MPVPSTSGPAISRRLHKDAVFDHLVAAVLDGTLRPGERLRDADHEGWLGVSRTPIRVALAKLEHVQLVESRGGRATSVVIPRRETALDLVTTGCGLLTAALGVLDDGADERGRLAIAARLRDVAELCPAGSTRPAVDLVDALFDAWTAVWSIVAGRPTTDLVVQHAQRLALPLRHHLRALSTSDLVLATRVVAEVAGGVEGGPGRPDGPSTTVSPSPRAVSSALVHPRCRSDDVALRRRLSDDVHDLVLTAVLDGTLAPGERLVDHDLIAWLGVSRTPIRQALERLDATGLVELAPNRYTRVARPRPSDVVDARELYASLASWAGDHAPAEDDLDDIPAAVARLRPIVERAEGRPLTLATAARLGPVLRRVASVDCSRSLSREIDLLEPRLAHGVVSCDFGLPRGSWRSFSSAVAGTTGEAGRGRGAAVAVLLRSLSPQAG